MKYNYTFQFISLNDEVGFKISSDKIEVLDEFLSQLIPLFYINNSDKPTVELIQKNTVDLNRQISSVINNFSKKYPILHNLKKFIQNLEENQFFCFLPNIETNNEFLTNLHIALISKRDNTNIDELQKRNKDLFGELIKNYNIYSYGKKRVFIGERIKSRRICRFCGNNSDKTSFKKTAHSISEALGNKKVFIYEECDFCNDKFSMSIEPDIVNYFSLFRTMFGVNAKGGYKKIKGDDVKIFYDKEKGSVNFNYTNRKFRLKDRTQKYELPIINLGKVSSQKVYKSLCKFFLSCIKNNYLDDFKETIRWVNEETDVVKLPKIAEIITYDNFTLEPILFVYINKSKENNLPYAVGEFRFACTITVFIIPLVKGEENKFLEENMYQKFWNFFKHFSDVNKSWSFKDFSDNKRKNYSVNLVANLTKNKTQFL